MVLFCTLQVLSATKSTVYSIGLVNPHGHERAASLQKLQYVSGAIAPYNINTEYSVKCQNDIQ